MTWTGHTYAAGEVLASSKMTTLQANFQAMASGDAGAPNLSQASYPLSITQSKLQTTTASGSLSLTGETHASYTLTGGTYSWWTASAAGSAGVLFGNGDVAAGVIGLIANVVDDTFYIDERYVQASPPYNLGNGDVPLFVFALLSPLSELRGLQIMPDPPWAYHGPTDIRARRHDRVSGRSWGLFNGEEVELTPQFKNSDMPLVPHPFQRFKRNEDRVVLVDPLSAHVQKMFELLEAAGASEVRRLFSYFEIVEPRHEFNTPPGVLGVSVK